MATYLLNELEKIAKENKYSSFSATVLRENVAMIHVFKKKYPNAKVIVNSSSDITMHMNFNDTASDEADSEIQD